MNKIVMVCTALAAGAFLFLGCASHDSPISGSSATASVSAADAATAADVKLTRIEVPSAPPMDGETAVIGDFNSDGVTDTAFFPRQDDGQGRVALIDGNAFAINVVANAFPLSSGITAAASADFDEDGDTDVLVITCAVPARVVLFLNSWSQTKTVSFQVAPTSVGIPDLPHASALLAFDKDGDGDRDVAVVSDSLFSTSFHYLENRVAETRALSFVARPEVFAGAPSRVGHTRKLMVLDVNGDRRPDIYAPADWKDYLFIQQADGRMVDEAAARGLVREDSELGMTVADLDSDGDSDIVTVNVHDVLYLALNDGAGHFALVNKGEVACDPSALVAADVTGDNHLDLVATSDSVERKTYTLKFTGVSAGVPEYAPVTEDLFPLPLPAGKAVDEQRLGQTVIAIPAVSSKQRSQLYVRRLVRSVTLDKSEACPGESVLVSVDAAGSEVTIDGHPASSRYVQFDGAPGPRRITVSVRSGKSVETRTVELRIRSCDPASSVFPIVNVMPNPYHPFTVDFSVRNGGAFAADSPTYIYEFGDGQRAEVGVPFISHDYSSSMNRDEPTTRFNAKVTVRRAGRPDVVTPKTVVVGNAYGESKARGFLQPPVTTNGRALPSGSDLTANLTIRNLEDSSLEFTTRRIELQYCDTTRDPTDLSSQAVSVAIAGQQSSTQTITLPKTALGSDVCGIAVHFTGTAPALPGVTALASAYFEVPNTRTALAALVADAGELALLRKIVNENLVADPDRITDEDIRRLAAEGKISLPAAPAPINMSPSAGIGDVCQPGDLPPRDGLACVPTDRFETVQSAVVNALKGDLLLVAACAQIGQLLRRVSPTQIYSHEGIMTKHYTELRHSTAAANRFPQFPHDKRAGRCEAPTDGIREDALKYGFPGSDVANKPRTMYEAFWSYILPDPELSSVCIGDQEGFPADWRIDTFNPNPNTCEGDARLNYPLVVKPPPNAGIAVRQALQRAADQALQIHGHYRLGAFSDAAMAFDPNRVAPPGSGWPAGTVPTVSSQFIWFALKKAGITLEGGALENADIARGAESDPQTMDGLYLYNEDERASGAFYIRNSTYNMVYASAGWFGEALTDVSDDIANQITNCFARDDCGHGATDSIGWLRPGVGRAVSPDNFLFWDAPPVGVYGRSEALVFRQGVRMRIYNWAPAPDTGTVTVTVLKQGSPLPDAVVTMPSVRGLEQKATGPDGRASFDAIPAGPMTVEAQFNPCVSENPAPPDCSSGQVFYSGRTDTTIVAKQNNDVTVTLQPPPETQRLISADIADFHIYDDETIGEEEVHVPVHLTCRVDRFGRLDPPAGVDRLEHTSFEMCVGDEVVARLAINCTLAEDDRSVKVRIRQWLFEGTDCGTPGDKLRDFHEETVTFVPTPPNHTYNVDTSWSGGDFARGTMVIKNERAF